MSIVADMPAAGVTRIRIDRPAARNAIDDAVRGALLEAIDRAGRDARTRALVIGGTGGVFSAGGDLPSLMGLDHDGAIARLRSGHALVTLLWEFPKPVVAAVERFAVGAGAGLALLADEIVASASSAFIFPFLRLGLVPDWGISGSLRRRVGERVAARLIREAATVKGEEAVAIGLVDQRVADEAVMADAIGCAARLAQLPPGAFARSKAMLRGPAEAALGLRFEAEAQARCIVSEEFAEGYAALQEKRAPHF